MKPVKTILPSHHSMLQKALEQAMAPRVDPDIIRASASIEETAGKLLPYLAYQWAVGEAEGWSYAESDGAKRELLRRAVEIHRYRGTPHSIRLFFRTIGVGEVEILENIGLLKYNGKANYDGTYIHGGDGRSTWATYAIKLYQPITIDQAVLIRRILEKIAPKRSELTNLDYRQAAIRYNGVARFDGQYTYGEA